MADLGLNLNLYPVLPVDKHISDADAELLFASAKTDSPWLEAWLANGGTQNALWCSGLEHLVYMQYQLSQICGIGVAVHDNFGWRGSGILSACGHTVEFKTANGEYAQQYLNSLPFTCQKCAKLMEN